MGQILTAITLLGFSSGLPLALVSGTLQAWLKSAQVPIEIIGLFALVQLPYSLKFLWSPLMDRYAVPWLGRRRGWILAIQIGLALALAGMAFVEPTPQASPILLISALPSFMSKFFTDLSTLMSMPLARVAFLVAFLSASQDIVIDAYKTDVLEEKHRGTGAAMANAGYRIAMLVSGALALALADHAPWSTVYLVMAATMGIGAVGTFLAPEPKIAARVPTTLKAAVVEPFVEFLKRRGAWEILAFVVLYRMDVIIATSLTTPFLMDIGFSKTDIAWANKAFGIVAVIAGTIAGGALMTKWSMKRSLWVFGWFQGVSGLTFMALAHVGHSYPLMIGSIATENFCSGLGTAAYSAFLMSLCDKRFTATQFALLTSLMALTRFGGGAVTGYLQASVGWENLFIVSLFTGIPGLLLLLRYNHWTQLHEKT